MRWESASRQWCWVRGRRCSLYRWRSWCRLCFLAMAESRRSAPTVSIWRSSARLVAYGAYRLIAGRSAITSTRRAVAAGIAGYCAVNVSALLAAVEFGIQPLLYHDASGAPLYCPYPLSVAIPAMMLGHLTIAGVAEAFVSGGVVAFLQRSDPSVLQPTTHTVRTAGASWPPVSRHLRPLWAALAVLLVLTPLGILSRRYPRGASGWRPITPTRQRALKWLRRR